MKEKSGTNSSRTPQTLRLLYSVRTHWDALFTTHALPSERLTHANNQMRSERSASGSTSMPEKGNTMQQQQMHMKSFMHYASSTQSHFPRMLRRVTVSMSIGHWARCFILRRGFNTLPDSEVFVVQRVYRLMQVELVISHLYCELPEPTTENQLPS